MSNSLIDRNVAAVRKLCERWPWLTAAEFSEIMTADCDYRNVPIAGDQHIGPVAAHEVLSRIRDQWDVELTVLAIVGNETRVLTERNERFVHKAGKKPTFDLPVMGVCEMRDGKIAAWRDYFERSQMKLA